MPCYLLLSQRQHSQDRGVSSATQVAPLHVSQRLFRKTVKVGARAILYPQPGSLRAFINLENAVVDRAMPVTYDESALLVVDLEGATQKPVAVGPVLMVYGHHIVAAVVGIIRLYEG